MTDASGLFSEFCDAFNAELAALGCDLRIDRQQARPDDTMLLLDAQGNDLGWLPDHVDAASIAAFKVILERHSHLRL